MHAFSRELIVGLLLVLATTTSGCQPVPPLAASSIPRSETSVGSEPVTDTAVIETPELPAEIPTETPASVAVVENVSETPAVASDSVTATVDMTVTTGSKTTSGTGAADADPALLAAGMATYRAQYCGICHTLDAAETRGTFGPDHNGIGAMAAARIAESSYSGGATTPAEYLYESIVDPQAYIVSGYATTSHRMPSYAHLDEATLDGLVTFLLAQQ